MLDEATSNLDSETEMQFLQCSNEAFRGKTVITIAVRFEILFSVCSVWKAFVSFVSYFACVIVQVKYVG